MNAAANPLRGEAAIELGSLSLLIRPTFSSLVAAESELGSLLSLADRAAEGQLLIAEMAALVWHCVEDRPDALTREALGEAIVANGLGAILPAVRMILRQVLAGSA